LGASGALFQNLLRNPLGSPDVVGFSMGSSVGAVVAITFFQASMVGITLGSLIGALATSGCVYALAYRNGAQSYRLILVGVGVSLTLSAFVNYLLARVNLGQALTAQIWLTGSLNGRGWNEVVPTAIALVVLLPLSCGTARSLGLLEMGDGVARALGVRVEQTRLAVLLLAVALVAIATAAAGPISFVALAAPQVARRLTRFSGVGVLAAAQVGAVVVLVADWIAQNLFPTELPVGVATGAVGGVYLAWLLSREWRRT
jgi:iron complex transport system permease protein